MSLGRGLTILGTVLVALSCPTAGFAQDVQEPARKQESPIVIDADSLSLNRRTQILEAQGNVEIRREEMILKADQVTINQATKDAEAKGKVFIDQRDKPDRETSQNAGR